MSALPAILEVSIGTVLIFLTLSAICSSLAEFISNALDLRARYLEQGIIALLADPESLVKLLKNPPSAGELAADVLRHPLLQKLEPTGTQNPLVRWLRQLSNSHNVQLPASITSEAFSSALLDELRRRAPNYGTRLTALRMRLRGLADALPQKSIGETSSIPSVILEAIAGRDAKLALEQIRLSLPMVADPQVRATVTNLIDAWELQQVRQGIETLPPSRAREALLTLVDESENRADRMKQLRIRVEQWFDDGMGQVSFWYKRHISWFLRAFAVIVVVAFNADAFRIADSLWRDPTLRQAMVAQAQMVTTSSGATLTSDGVPVGPVQQVEVQLAEMQGLPLGWTCDQYNALFREGHTEKLTAGAAAATEPAEMCGQIERIALNGHLEVVQVDGGHASLSGLGLKLIGLGLMAAGVSLGSTFWYRLLKQLVSWNQARKN